MNRTGIGTSPIDRRRTIQGAIDAQTAGPLNGEALAAERISWARGAAPIGTVPPPATARGIMKTMLEKLEGHKPTVFIDKLGERLAFERTGTRLYEAVMAKLAAAAPHPGGPTRTDLERIHDAELRHFMLVRGAIAQLGADPTAQTPGADLVGVAGLGWAQAVSDPRTTLDQCLGIMMIAELADQDGWLQLISLASHLRFDDLATQFEAALDEEERHVLLVRGWITTSLLGEAGVERGSHPFTPVA